MKTRARNHRNAALWALLAIVGPLAAAAATLDVSQPLQLSGDAYYERGQSILHDGSDYWLFYGRSASCTDPYASGNPDVYDYVLYYKKAEAIEDLATAAPEQVGDVPVTDSYLGETAAAWLDGKVWVFTTLHDGSNTDLFGYWTDDGGAGWNAVGPYVEDMSGGQGHHDAVVFDGELWLLEGSGDYHTQHSATPENPASFGAPLQVGAGEGLTGGLGHFFVDGSSLYLALGSGGSYYIYLYDDANTEWDLIASKSIASYYDPTLFKVGSDYVFYCAPYAAGRQWIVGWTAASLDASFFDGDEVAVSEARYGDNVWVDMWPIGFQDGADSWLFFSSERDEPGAEGAGNIWCLKVDWDPGDDHYTYIQEAVDAAAPGDAIFAAAGDYVEQVVVDKDLTITGAGAGSTNLICPGAMPVFFNSGSNDNYPVLYVHDADVDVTALTIDGDGQGNANFRFIGMAFFNAGGSLSDAEVLNIIDTPFSGAQHGVGVYAWNDTGGPYEIAMDHVLVDEFQKTAVALMGEGLSCDLDFVTTHGAGATTVTAQNGLQFAYGSGGTVDDCVITDVAYTPTDWTASGLLVYGPGSIDATSVDIDGCETSVYYIDAGGSFDGGSVTNPLGDALYAYASSATASDGYARVAPSPFDGAEGQGGRSSITFSMAGSSFTGAGVPDSWGPTAYAEGNVQFDMTDCEVSLWDFGVALYESGGIVTGAAGSSEFFDNDTYGVWSNTASPYDARGNWWGDATGPYHPSLNLGGLGDEVSDNVLFEPWTGQAALSVLPVSSGPFACGVDVPLIFHYTPDESTPPLRGYEITVGCDAGLDFDETDVTDLGALGDIGDQSFYVTDNEDGTYTVSAALLGPTGGLTVEDDLFSIDFATTGSGAQDVEILSYKLRDLDNAEFFATVEGAVVEVDCDGPVAPVLAAEPDFTQGTSNTVSWSDESASGAVEYYAECSLLGDFSVILDSSGWIAGLSHEFAGLADDTEQFYRVKARDALANESVWSNVESSTQDDNDPVSEAGPLDAYQTSLTFDVPYTADDATSGVDYVELYYQLDGGAWNPAGGTYSGSPISFTAGGDGEYCFFTVATDLVGNVEANPPAGDACSTVDTTEPDGTFVIDGDAAFTTSTAVTLDNAITDANGVVDMQFSNDGGTWSGWTAYAATHPWTLESGDGVKTVYAQFRDGAGLVLDIDDDITLDTAPPGAAAELAGEAGHEKAVLSWTDPGDGDLALVEIWRGPWHDGSYNSAYPEYDDLDPDVIPTRPADRDAADASPEWTLAGTAPAGDQAFTDDFAPRGIYYYELFARDLAGNYGPPLDENVRVMNYWLGDVTGDSPYDGYVDVDDITQLGASFGTEDGEDPYDNEIDVGPTDDWSRLGIPLTDDVVDFEDLMIFAMNYDVVAPRPSLAGAIDHALLTWYPAGEDSWALGLLEPCFDMKAIRLRAALPEGVEVALERGAVIDQQGGVPVFLRNVERHGLDVSLAVMGTGASLQGDGELFRVTLNGPVDLAEIEIQVRGSDNRPLDLQLETLEIPALPETYALARNFPNPFNPKTTIRFDLPDVQNVCLVIFDTSGRRINTLLNETLQPGFHSVVWNGRDERGKEVASGVYFYRIDAGPLTQTKRMVLLK